MKKGRFATFFVLFALLSLFKATKTLFRFAFHFPTVIPVCVAVYCPIYFSKIAIASSALSTP